MRHYEIVFMVHPDQSDQVSAMVERYTGIIEGDNGKVQEDKNYSGKYLVAGLSHTWNKEGVTTTLELIRDSVRK